MQKGNKLIKWANELRYTITKKLKKTEHIFFISDIHLGDGTHTDLFGYKDEIFINFLDHVKKTGDKLVIIGDAMDFLQAWSFDRIIKAHRNVLKKLKELADEIDVIYVYGNHDTDIVLFQDILNFQVCDKLEIGEDILVEHGHLHDNLSLKHHKFLKYFTLIHNIIERLSKAHIHVPLKKFYNIPNRFLHWVAYRFMQFIKFYAFFVGLFGFKKKKESLREVVRSWFLNSIYSSESLYLSIRRKLEETKYNTIIVGHSHVPGLVLENGKAFINTGSWALSSAYYGYWDGNTFTLKHWITGKEVNDENYKEIIKTKKLPQTYEWWKKHYKFFLRFKY